MHFLITNDDGILAPGIAALAEAVKKIPEATYTIVAPESEYSQCGHRVTTHQQLVVNRLDAERFSVVGTPADCIRIALYGLNLKPDFVLSGVNAGGNMGQDIPISGTLAGMREAAYHGLPGAALSHYKISGIEMDWPRISEWSATLLQELQLQTLADGEFWNVNFPHHPPGRLEMPPRLQTQPCRFPLNVGFKSEQIDENQTNFFYHASYQGRPVQIGSDVEACFGGNVSVSRLKILAC